MLARGRVAVVTGGTRGIGLGVCRSLAREGWGLALCGVRPAQAVQDVLSELRRSGGAVEYIQADVASAEDRIRLVEQVVARLGTVDALVNNAGRAPRIRADLLEASEESFEELMRTNLQGPYFLTQAIARLLIQRRGRGDGGHTQRHRVHHVRVRRFGVTQSRRVPVSARRGWRWP